MNKKSIIEGLMQERILILDGAMGSMIQRYGLKEEDFRGDVAELKNSSVNLAGNNDLLNITRPDIIKEIHRAFLEAGADLIETNTFNATAVSQSDYNTEMLSYRLNMEGARIAREEADKMTKMTPEKPRFVVGSLGPTSKTLSISPDVNNPGHRDITFQELKEDYLNSVKGLVDGGADILLIETVFDTLNAKAAIYAVKQYFAENKTELPVMISGTITDASGRTLSGQTAEAFYYSVVHADPISIGFNCALGAEDLKPHLESLSSIAWTGVSSHPNAGLPNELGEYDQSPDYMASIIEKFARDGLLNIVGGCCGTTPEHIKAIADRISGFTPRVNKKNPHKSFYSGLEPLIIEENSLFINVGERNNVTGSRKFARLIREKQYEEALEISRKQVTQGAQIIDVNLDEAMLDSKQEMVTFLNLIASEPEISKVPIMIDSSKWDVIKAGLECIQGKGIVNSISLKEGEENFIHQAREVMNYGAAAIIMAFDEEGQADTFQRKLEICTRSYKVLTEKVGFPPEDIIFDPNIFAVATGIKEHNNYAVDFIQAVKKIKETLPYARISGGVSNVSFSFRGNNPVREAIHAVFLYYAIKEGMDMGIVNAGQLAVYDDIPGDILERVEDVVLNRRDDATERLLDVADTLKGQKKEEKEDLSWRENPVEQRIIHAMVKGLITYLDEDVEELRLKSDKALDVIEGPLMAGMDQVGELFGSGKMFLPQVVKSARVMKKAVAFLLPYIEAEKEGKSSSKGKILMATVKGDVHDIGKNIVKVVLQCNNFEVIDMGVMVPCSDILKKAREENVDAIGLSGLITPSLDEMVHVASEMEKSGMKIPLFIGGATTSKIHTAVKIAPAYSNTVVYVPDASKTVGVLSKLLNTKTKKSYASDIREEYKELVKQRESKTSTKKLLSLSDANNKKYNIASDYTPPKPSFTGTREIDDIKINTLEDFIDWRFYLYAWGLNQKDVDGTNKKEEIEKLLHDGKEMLNFLRTRIKITASVGFFKAESADNSIIVHKDNREYRFPMLRQQDHTEGREHNWCLSDFILPREREGDDHIGFFACTAGNGMKAVLEELEHDDYKTMLVKTVADRLAEACSEYLHKAVRVELWGYDKNEKISKEELLLGKYRGIRPAPGYPACPDHRDKEMIFDLLEVKNIQLTESFMMMPASSVCGYYFSHPDSRYFTVGKVNDEQLESYAELKKEDLAAQKKWLSSICT